MSQASREWVTFADPKEDGRTWQLDVTFLLSSWQCIFGAGCQGVLDREGARAGARLLLLRRVLRRRRRPRPRRAASPRSSPTTSGSSPRTAGPKGIYKKMGRDEDGNREWHTRLVKDACIFLNRVGFAAGPGCALHLHAMNTGQHHSEVKPEVCWQLPLRRVDEEQEDGVGHLDAHRVRARRAGARAATTSPGGAPRRPRRSRGKEPVYRSLDAELRKTLGKKLHKQVVEYLDARGSRHRASRRWCTPRRFRSRSPQVARAERPRSSRGLRGRGRSGRLRAPTRRRGCRVRAG